MENTVKRLWTSVSNQHKRLAVVLASVVFYEHAAVYHRAAVQRAYRRSWLWNSVQEAAAGGAAFQVTWADGGRDIFLPVC